VVNQVKSFFASKQK